MKNRILKTIPAWLVLLFVTLPATAQEEGLEEWLFAPTISALEQNLDVSSDTGGHPSGIRLFRFPSLTEEPEIRVGMELYSGDKLVSPSEKNFLEVHCGVDTVLKFSGSFQIVIQPADELECAVDLEKGSVDVVADVPSRISSGETVLGSERTQYGLRVRASEQGIEKECFVYDGSIRVTAPSFSGEVMAGNKLVVLEGRQPLVMRIEPSDILRTAEVFARIAVSKAKKDGPAQMNPQKALSRLTTTYQKVFEAPENPDYRLKLAVELVNQNTSTEAVYHLDRAERLSAPKDTRTQAAIALTRGVSYKQLGQDAKSAEEVQKAQTLDPQVLEPQNLQVIELDPMAVDAIKIQPIIVPQNLVPLK